jgi:hypothetical protein
MSEEFNRGETVASGLISTDSYCLPSGFLHRYSEGRLSSGDPETWSFSSVASFGGSYTQSAGGPIWSLVDTDQFPSGEGVTEDFAGRPTDQDGTPEADPVSCIVEKPKPA